MNKRNIHALIVDDERKSRDVLSGLLTEFCPQVKIAGQASDIDEASELILEEKPDLVFLDIQMPGGTGFNLLDKFDKVRFRTIFTTSYDQYAIQAIRWSAIDYLLKPVRIDELVKAVEKMTEGSDHSMRPELIELAKENLQHHSSLKKLALPTLDGFCIVSINEIVYCEANSNYTSIFLSNGQQMLVSRTLKEFDDSLSERFFFRIHHSHLINLDFVKKYLRSASSVIMENGKELIVSTRKKQEFVDLLKKWGAIL